MSAGDIEFFSFTMNQALKNAIECEANTGKCDPNPQQNKASKTEKKN